MKVKSESEVAQSCPTLGDPMDCSLPGSSIHGIFQARVLEWVAIAFSAHFFSNGYAVFLSKFGKFIPLIFGSDGKESIYHMGDSGLIPPGEDTLD